VWDSESRQKLELGVDPTASPYAKSASYRDTIGSMTYYQGMAPMRVRGYGLVVGLGHNGSSECPRAIFDRLVQALYKQHNFTSSVVGVRNIKPEALIEDLDTAVVLVHGEIPPGAVAGSRFDVVVTAVPGTQTKSLRGGRLYTADLEMYRAVTPNAALSGRVLARASGPLFLNPFSEGDAATQSVSLEGIILGGGEVTEDRRLRLVLLQPSYHFAQKIQDRINAQMPATDKIADAISPSFVRLAIPEEFRNDSGHFLALVRALYLSNDPRFAAARARELGEEILHPTAPHGQIALCLEGLGRAALPVLDELYTNEKDYVSFHAAVAGVRLGDHLAADVMAMHAETPNGEYRFRAIRALGEARGMAGAGMCLRRLLDDVDPRIQIAAYEALLERRDPVIKSMCIGGDNFSLDRVPSERPSFIYVKRQGSRRIAVFGDEPECGPPLLYRAPDGSVTITAGPNDDHLTVLRVVTATNATSPAVPVHFDLGALLELLGSDAGVDHDGQVTGLAVDYAAIARALYHLSRDKAIDASFVLEQPNVAELFGPARPRGRPESELSFAGS
jgi:hypothetical protein